VLSFHKKISSLFKFYKSRKSQQYYLPVLFGIIYKLNSIALFLIPIQAIKSVSEGNLSKNLKDVLALLNIFIPPDEYIYLYFLIWILISLLTLTIINRILNITIKNIKIKLTLKSKRLNYQLTKKDYYRFNKNITKIDNFIEMSQNLFFCLVLSLFIIFYDLQIALILLSGGFLYMYLIKLSNKNKFAKNKFNKLGSEPNKDSSLYFKIDKKIKSNFNYEDLFIPYISTFTMLLIMSAVYLRVDPSISIIFIFLIRIFQSNMLNSLKKFVIYDKKFTSF
jgi:hypothetical protein